MIAFADSEAWSISEYRAAEGFADAIGLWAASAGELSFRGRSLRGLATPDIASLGIAYVPENMGIFTDLTVQENMVLAARAGVATGQLPMEGISCDPARAEARGPTGTAFREGRVQACPDLTDNPTGEPWRQGLLALGFFVHLDAVLRQDLEPHRRHLAIDLDPALGNPVVGLAARAQTQLGQALVQARCARLCCGRGRGRCRSSTPLTCATATGSSSRSPPPRR